MYLLFFFFFSSRRRHTRLQGDWSSDVCSSDVPGGQQIGGVLAHEGAVARAHQGLGIGRGAVVEMVQVAAAAGIEGQGTALGILKTAGTGLESGGSAPTGWAPGTFGTCGHLGGAARGP